MKLFATLLMGASLIAPSAFAQVALPRASVNTAQPVFCVDATTGVPGGCGGSGGGGVTGVTTTTASGAVTTHLTFQAALASNVSRKGCLLQNTSADLEYVEFIATGSASTSASFQLSSGQSISCVVGGGQVATDNIAITSKVTDGATYVVTSQ